MSVQLYEYEVLTNDGGTRILRSDLVASCGKEAIIIAERLGFEQPKGSNVWPQKLKAIQESSNLH